ncbi:MAG: hypothetical protein HYW48_00125 [Deltaproteobacteria bacterium]|nr:hypothetical protein [Deltaproteobacteria bacterium]
MRKLVCALLLATSFLAQAKEDQWFTIPNSLYLEDRIDAQNANMGQAEFDAIINQVKAVYAPIITAHGATLTVNHLWTNPTVNASASQSGNNWYVNMYGGLARRPETSPDGFALVVCHEIGHHLGGYPFYGAFWAASEGQSDYFATQACARKVWKDDVENARFRDLAPMTVKVKCNAVWQDENDQNMCYRTFLAGKSLGDLLSTLNGSATTSFETFDPNVVTRTATAHPLPQCRLDTYTAGALCRKALSANVIPGKAHPSGQTSLDAEYVAADHSCMRANGVAEGRRPRCWFAPQVGVTPVAGTVQITEVRGNNNGVPDPGEQVNVKVSVKSTYKTDKGGAWMTVSTQTPKISVNRSKLTFSTLPPNVNVASADSILVTLGGDVPCGSNVKFDTETYVNLEVDRSSFDMRVGTFRDLEQLVNDQQLLLPKEKGSVQSVIRTTHTEAAQHLTFEWDLDVGGLLGSLVTLQSPSGQIFTINEPMGAVFKHLSFDLAKPEDAGDWTLSIVNKLKVPPTDDQYLKRWSLRMGDFQCPATNT